MQTLLTGLDVEGFTSKDLKVLSVGEEIAKKTKDKFHGIAHIKTLLEDYKKFKKDNSSIGTDDKVVAHSIVYHDSYKAQKTRSKLTLGIILEEMYEGLGSAFIYKKEAQKAKIDPEFLNKVVYAIRKHSIGNILPRATKEAQILFDLDELDSFDPKRYVKASEYLDFSLDTQVRLAISHLKMRTKMGFYFEWTKAEFDKKKNKFIEGVISLRDKVLQAKKDMEKLDDVIQGI